jgi:hypothetical protein
MSRESCARCTDLALRWAIENPADLTRSIHVVRDHLDHGGGLWEPV